MEKSAGQIEQKEQQDINKLGQTRRILIPVGIGLAVTGWMLYRSFDIHALRDLSLSDNWYCWLAGVLLAVVVRDFGYMMRIRELAQRKLSWKKSFEVIMLWEFCSAIMPGILGGGFAFAIAIIHKEGMKLGKAISMVVMTTFLDGIFFAVLAPLAWFIFGSALLFSESGAGADATGIGGRTIETTFWIIYTVVLLYKLLVAYALFINANSVKHLLSRLFSLPLLRRWKASVEEVGDDMIIASEDLRNFTFQNWFFSFLSTMLSWSARFFLVNCMLGMFLGQFSGHLLLYARQVVMGILLIGSPTPGSSGVAEFIFTNLLGSFISNPSKAVFMSLLWRVFSYYPYLLVGLLVFPGWARRIWGKKEKPE
jgi:hypothetical protein